MLEFACIAVLALFSLGLMFHYAVTDPVVLGAVLGGYAAIAIILFLICKLAPKAMLLFQRTLRQISGMGIPKLCVLTYLLFVFGSLVIAPWEGWEMDQDWYRIYSQKKWVHVVRYDPIFSPPSNLYGANPSLPVNSFGLTANYQQSQRAKDTPPRLKTEVIVLLWGAFGIMTGAVVWLGSNKKQPTESSPVYSALLISPDSTVPSQEREARALESRPESTTSIEALYDLAHDAALDAAIQAIRAKRAVADVIKIAVGRFKERFPDHTPEHVATFEKALRETLGAPAPELTKAGAQYRLAHNAAIDAALAAIDAGHALSNVIKIAVGRFKERFPGHTPENVASFEKAIRDTLGAPAGAKPTKMVK